MLFELILSIITSIILLIASYTDLKTREIPDWLSFAFILSIAGIRLIFAVEYGWDILLQGILGFCACFIVGCIFYYSHQWGGGDSKLLMGMGLVIGIAYPFSEDSFALVLFFLFLLFFGAVYGLCWMLVQAWRKREEFWKECRILFQEHALLHKGLGGVSLLFVGATILYLPLWPLIIFPLGIFYLFLFVYAAEKSCFVRTVDPSALVEGDWLAKPVIVENKTILPKKTLQQIDINQLQELKKNKKIITIVIKDGIPFTPAFIIAFVVLVLWNPYLKPFLLNLF